MPAADRKKFTRLSANEKIEDGASAQRRLSLDFSAPCYFRRNGLEFGDSADVNVRVLPDHVSVEIDVRNYFIHLDETEACSERAD